MWGGARPGPQAVLPSPSQLRSGERIKLIPLLCIVCTSVVWGFALFFFFQGLSTWQVSSPAGGRVAHRLIVSQQGPDLSPSLVCKHLPVFHSRFVL